MSNTLTITSERVDDLPLLLAQMHQMDLPHLLASYFPVNGNWQGLDPGWLSCLWLAHILSQADHRLSYVQPWVERTLLSLQQATGQSVRPLDFSDDRLARLLELFSDDEHWALFEAALNRRLLRVYDLRAERIRLDSTTASGYWQVDEDSLFQFGHSKDHRPDLPQVKVMLASLDPLPLPLVSQVLPGQAADDPLYGPAIAQVRRSVGRGGLLYVGDSKMGALATRSLLQAGRDYYLCPLEQKQLPADWGDEYLRGVRDQTQALVPVQRPGADGELITIAEGYERRVELQATVEEQPLTWTERRLVVRSLGVAKRAEAGLQQRLAAAQAELAALHEQRRGKARPADRAALAPALDAILDHHRVRELLRVTLAEQWHERTVRGYKGRPARLERRWDFHLTVTVDEAALAAAVARLGWRVYATNQPASELPLEGAVLAYREEYLIEQSIGRLKGAPLSLCPCYVQRDDHVKGLVRLLLLGVRVLSLLEFGVRRALAHEGTSLAGLYAGQPKARTARPSAERLLASFKNITLTRIQQDATVQYHLPPLSALQTRILTLAGLAPAIYTKLTRISAQPP